MKNSRKSEESGHMPGWLERVQERSWEPEILISGIVLYGLFKIFPLIEELNYFLEYNSIIIFSNGTVNEALAAIFTYANSLLIVGFITHLFFRSVWAAFVGLSYVYKNGVNYHNLPYHSRYIKLIGQSGDYVKQIILLEKICSVIFSLSFLIFMWLVGLSLFFMVFAAAVAIYMNIFPGDYDFTILDITITFMLALTFIDFVTLGGLKRLKYVNKLYYPIYRVISWLTLSFLYRNIYYGLISNHRKWKVGLLFLAFSAGSFVIVNLLNNRSNDLVRSIELVPQSRKYRLDESVYRNLVDDGFYSKYMHIDRYTYDRPILKLFIVHTTRNEEEWIKPACNYEEELQKGALNVDSLRFACLEKFYDVHLDGILLDDNFIYQRNDRTKQDGLLKVINLKGLKTGKHQIELYYNFYYPNQDSTYHKKISELDFYFSGSD